MSKWRESGRKTHSSIAIRSFPRHLDVIVIFCPTRERSLVSLSTVQSVTPWCSIRWQHHWAVTSRIDTANFTASKLSAFSTLRTRFSSFADEQRVLAPRMVTRGGTTARLLFLSSLLSFLTCPGANGGRCHCRKVLMHGYPAREALINGSNGVIRVPPNYSRFPLASVKLPRCPSSVLWRTRIVGLRDALARVSSVSGSQN